MIQERNIVTCIILSIITCGIYGIYWEICLVNDLNVAADTPNDTSGGMVFLLSIITCGIYMLYCIRQAKRYRLLRQREVCRLMPTAEYFI